MAVFGSGLRAGLGYFVAVFAAGTLFGVARVFLLEPAVSRLNAVLLELPLMLAACAIIAVAIVRVARVPYGAARVVMGATMFVCLQAAEFLLALATGTTPTAYLAAMATAAGLAGLAGQALAATFPIPVRI